MDTVDAQFSGYYPTAAGWLKGSAIGLLVYGLIDDEAIKQLSTAILVEAGDDYAPLERSLRVEFEDRSGG